MKTTTINRNTYYNVPLPSYKLAFEPDVNIYRKVYDNL